MFGKRQRHSLELRAEEAKLHSSPFIFRNDLAVHSHSTNCCVDRPAVHLWVDRGFKTFFQTKPFVSIKAME